MRYWQIPILLVLFCVTILSMRPPAASGQERPEATRRQTAPVVVIDVTGAIGVGTGYMLEQDFARAERQRAGAVVLRIDTPGGLVSVTREIIQRILASPVPVIAFVAPSGARAASAGTYITYAAHVAAMAPGTHIGAATPVQMGMPGLPAAPQAPDVDKPAADKPEPDKSGAKSPGTAMENKVLNDAVAYLRSLAQLRGRNADWAGKAVRDAATLTAKEAVQENVVDLLADDLGDLLDQLDGRKVRTVEGMQILRTRNASVITLEPGWRARLLTVITDPNIAFILMMIGVYGIIFEFWSPGLAGPGIVGAICLIVGLMALSALPLNFAGLALLALGVTLMAAEAFAPGFGVLGLGGVIAFILGGLFLFDPAGADISFAVSWPVLLAAAATNAALIIGLLGMILRVRRRKVMTGAEEMLGLEGEVLDWHGDQGRVRMHGETWSARAPAPLEPGTKVRVGRRDGLTLYVEPVAIGT